jgi:hypothetical protein
MVAPTPVSVAMHQEGVIVLAVMLRVIVILFFTIAFACQSVSFKLDVDGAQFITLATHSGVILTDSIDCDDDYRNSHAAPMLVAAGSAQLFTPLIRFPEFSRAQQFFQVKAPLFKLYAVLRI